MRSDDSATAAWRSVVTPRDVPDEGTPLALGVDLLVRSRDGSPWAPKRLTPATARTARTLPDDIVLGVRPLMPGSAAGSWVKGDVSWDAVRRPGDRFAERPARWFAQLHSIARELRTLSTYSDLADWLVLDTVDSDLLWPHLARARENGVAIVGARPRTRVRLARDADVSVLIDRGADGGYTLTPRVRIDGDDADAARARAIGATGIHVHRFSGAELDLVLAHAELGQTARRLLASPGPVAVPRADAAEFLAGHAARLARRERVAAGDGVTVPDPAPPALAISVTHRAPGDVLVELSWEYAGLGRRGLRAEPGEPDREHAAERALLDELAPLWQHVWDDGPTDALTLRDADAAEFCERVLPALRGVDRVDVVTRGTAPRYHELDGVPEISVTAVESSDPDWFDLGIVVTIDGRRIPFGDLFTALAMRRKRMMLSDGAHFSLAHPALDRLRDLIDDAADVVEWEPGARVSRYQLAVWADFEDLADQAQPAVSWRRTVEGLRDLEAVPATPVPAGVRAELRPYQKHGYDWLTFLWRSRLGGILADDMGLGKTLQALGLIAHMRESGEERPVLVVAPTSVLGTWRDEAARFAPGLRVHVADATRARADVALADAARASDIVVTSYAILRLDESAFADVDWAAAILDEAQAVKNPATRVHRAALALRADAIFALTGTPVENGLADLWALLALTSPGLFPSAPRFRRDYIGPIEDGKVPENAEGGPYRAARLDRLRRRIRPFVLRRTKERVAAELPPKQEQVLHVELSAAHRAVYDTILQRERQKVLGLLPDLDRNRFIVFRSITLLRMLSLAPELVDAGDGRIRSAKLDALVAQLDELAAEGHRALVFSQFTSFLDIVQRRLDADGIASARLDGSTRRRDDVVDGFRRGDAPVFLVSLKAGGVGLTLTEADYVFLLDPWWNPAAEAQAIDRTHRIGQDAPVMVYRLVAAGTIEEKVLALQQRKARLIHAVMDDDDLFARSLTADDVRDLLSP
ncbi:DEAD/DEAH box helicase [Microbacterium thalassium]|uniref:Superfamily II DNA or RNA helicase n=1 Tax=Microbacterium thalassium TaxID=362649 RepID=A0A7X0FQJ7_9MICO|nr:DEAD/DEAH box helicase [Microbacterium thalassium]MBB6391880.1 superfamily II DNA or RNA helicase [Microbacterium thalassium]GLK23900.1 DNA helicase [Microbacterium thalassium]